MTGPRFSIAERLERLSIPCPASGCHLWMGKLSRNGYGALRLPQTQHGRAHRASWEVHRGPVPKGLYVLHKCDVRSCINPDHLWVGTNAENNADMWRKGRGSPPPTGHRSNFTLTPDLVREIRRSPESKRVIAKRLGVGASTIGDVRTGATWGDIT